SSFVSAMHENLGDFKAARMHTVARAQTAFLDNVLYGIAVAEKTVAGAAITGGLGLFSQQCTCQDCQAASSSVFYLNHLLNYATNNVQRDGQNITLQALIQTFSQPFDGLEISCEAVGQRVRSARICSEILRAFLGSRPLSDAQKESALQKVEL